MAKARSSGGHVAEKPGRAFTRRTAAVSPRPSQADTAQATLPSQDIFSLTERKEAELLGFIVKHLNEGEKEQFCKELVKLVGACARTGSFTTVAEFLADWEATAEVNANPEFSKKLLQAAQEAEVSRRGSAR